VIDQTGSAMMWRRDGSELRRRGSEQCRGGGAVCRKRRIRVAAGVEWLRRGGSESGRYGGLADWSSVNAEAQLVEAATATRRRGGSESL
jgi:hypothetical protein